MSADPAMESYIPEASSNEGAGERNQNLPGLGGIYNSRNLQTYHYAGNNPLKYVDPTGKTYQTPAERDARDKAIIDMLRNNPDFDEDICNEAARIGLLQSARDIRAWIQKWGWLSSLGGGTLITAVMNGLKLAVSTTVAVTLGAIIVIIDIYLAQIERAIEKADHHSNDRENLEKARAELGELRGLYNVAKEIEDDINELKEKRNNATNSGDQSQISAQIAAKEKQLEEQKEAIENKKRELGLIDD